MKELIMKQLFYKRAKMILDIEVCRFEHTGYSEVLSAVVMRGKKFIVDKSKATGSNRKKAKLICMYLNRPEAVLEDKMMKIAMECVQNNHFD